MNLTFMIESSCVDDFIDHWSQRYFYDSEEKYISNIGKPLTEKSRLALYEWKNDLSEYGGGLKLAVLSFPFPTLSKVLIKNYRL